MKLAVGRADARVSLREHPLPAGRQAVMRALLAVCGGAVTVRSWIRPPRTMPAAGTSYLMSGGYERQGGAPDSGDRPAMAILNGARRAATGAVPVEDRQPRRTENGRTTCRRRSLTCATSPNR